MLFRSHLEKALSNIQEAMELCLELEEKERRITEGKALSDQNRKDAMQSLLSR